MAVTKAQRTETIRIQTEDDKTEGRITHIRLGAEIEVAAQDRWIRLWTAGREIRIGPLSAEQAEKLSEDLGYEAVQD